MAARTLTPARALRKPRRIDLRAMFGFFLMILAVGGSIAFWSSSSETQALLVADRDLPIGSVLTAADVKVTKVHVDDAIYRAAVPASERSTLIGKQLAEPLHAGQLLVRAQISTGHLLGPDQLAMTIAPSADRGFVGTMRPGDQVQVLVTTNKGKPETRTSVVLPRVNVYDVGHEDQFSLANRRGADAEDSSAPVAWITLIVSPEQTIALANAKWNGDLDIVLLGTQAQASEAR